MGRLLDGRYLVGARIARGGMATVYEATDLRLDRTVAVKVMPHTLAEDDEFTSRFVREARAAARLTSSNVVTVYDQGDDDGVLFLVMEYVPGRHTLRDIIRGEAPLPPGRALGLLEEIVKAIAFAHESGIIHRDLKPENVLIDPRGQLKVADFGLARAISASTAATATSGVLMGTVSYLPPELVVDGTSDARSDVYALGVMTFEMLTGTKPHDGDSPIQVAYKHVHEDVPPPSSVVDGIPGYLDAFVARATSRQRDLRPADAHVLLQQLRRVRHALDHGVSDDRDLTEDLSPTISLGATTASIALGSGLGVPAARTGSDSPARDEVFDFAAYGDPSPADRQGPDFVSGNERTIVVDSPRLPDTPPMSAPITLPDAVGSSGPSTDADTSPVPGGSTAANYPTDPAASPFRTRRSRRRGWIAFLIVLLLAAGAALGGWYYGVGRFRPTPDIVEMGKARAEKKVEAAGLTFEVAGTAYSETVRSGLVISTDPGPGDNVLKDEGTVTAVISKGPERYSVPDLADMSEAEAIERITEGSLTVGPISRQWSEREKAGEVLSFSPAAKTRLHRDDPVSLVVSRGPEPHEIKDYVGDDAAEARRELASVGFEVSVEREYDDNVAEGSVISQKPDDGVGYAGDTIELVVSLGPHLVEVPNVNRFGIEDAEDELADSGFRSSRKEFEPYLGLGFVVGQSPAAGELAPFGSTIVLTVV